MSNMVRHSGAHPVHSAEIETAIQVPQVIAQIVRANWDGKIDMTMLPRERYWLGFSFTPRPKDLCACYSEHWGEYRFERMGDVFIIPPGETVLVHSDVSAKGRASTQSFLICQLDHDFLSEWFGGDVKWTE